MPERRATLHEAMVAVLRGHDGWMDRDEVATEIARLNLWIRPSDGAAPDPDQIRLRSRKYPDLFELSQDKSSVRLSSDAPTPKPAARPLSQARLRRASARQTSGR